MVVYKISDINRKNVEKFFKEHWGSAEMVISSGVYNCDQLDGFLLEEDYQILGLVTYVIHVDEVEVISLDSVVEGRGIGSLLMLEVEKFVQSIEMRMISLVTTNDNLNALKFYQKRGYKIDAVFPNAVEKARQVKPTIPLIGNDGIPINDEIRLIKKF